MSEQPSTENAPEQQPPAGTEQASGESKTFDADYVKKLRDEAAKHRTEAKANADAAKRLAELEDAQKSEAEKAADRIAKAEAEVAGVPAKVADALKAHLVQLHEISDEDAELFLTATDPELLLKQVSRLMERNADAAKPRTPKPDPTQGQSADITALTDGSPRSLIAAGIASSDAAKRK